MPPEMEEQPQKSDIDALCRQASDLMKESKYAEAIAVYTQVIQLKPEDLNSHYNRGLAYRSEEEYDKAIQDFNTCIKLNPQNANAYYYRANLRDDLANADANLTHRAAAIQDYTKYLELHSDANSDLKVMAYCYRALDHIHLGNLDKAIEDFTQCIQLEPNNARWYYKRGETYFTMGTRYESVEDLRDSVAYFFKSGSDLRRSMSLDTSGMYREKCRRIIDERIPAFHEKQRAKQAAEQSTPSSTPNSQNNPSTSPSFVNTMRQQNEAARQETKQAAESQSNVPSSTLKPKSGE